MTCRHLELRPLPGPFKGLDARCLLADERANPTAFAEARKVLAATGLSAGLSCPHAETGTFVACSLHAPRR